MQSEDRAVAVQAQRDAAERLKWRKAEEVERRWKREQVNSTHASTHFHTPSPLLCLSQAELERTGHRQQSVEELAKRGLGLQTAQQIIDNHTATATATTTVVATATDSQVPNVHKVSQSCVLVLVLVCG